MRTVVALMLVTGFAASGCGQSVRRVPGEGEDETGGTGGAGTGGTSATGGSVEAGGSSAASGASGLGSATGGTGGSSSDGGGLGGSGALPASTCASVTLTSMKPDPMRVLFVIEASESLNEAASDHTNASRWELTQQALAPVLGALNDDVEAGVLYFPGRPDPDEACFHQEFAVPLALVEGRQPALLTGSLYNVDPSGEAATNDAFEFALEALTPPLRDAIVLVTDGAPDLSLSCKTPPTDERWSSLLGSMDHALLSHGVHTFVVGTFGSEPERPMLSQLARVGGLASPSGCSDDGPTYCHFDLTTRTDLATELVATLTPIRAATYSCDFDLPVPDDGTTPDLSDVVVTITTSTGEVIEFAWFETAGACVGLGFYVLEDPELPRVALCPEACEEVVGDATSLTISAGCSPPPL